MIGEPVGIRTRDLLIKRQLLHFEIKDAGDHHNQRTPTASNTMPPKKIVLPHIPLDSLARQALLSVLTALPGSLPAWRRAPGLRWCKHRDRRDVIQREDNRGQQANHQASKEQHQDRYWPGQQAGSQGRARNATGQSAGTVGVRVHGGAGRCGSRASGSKFQARRWVKRHS